MPYDAELADPLVEVRDVVESFRCCGVTPTDWRHSLQEAISALTRLPREAEVESRLPSLLPHLQILLAEEGLDGVPKVVSEVADQVAIVLRQVTIPGIPRPEEDNWGFDRASVS